MMILNDDDNNDDEGDDCMLVVMHSDNTNTKILTCKLVCFLDFTSDAIKSITAYAYRTHLYMLHLK